MIKNKKMQMACVAAMLIAGSQMVAAQNKPAAEPVRRAASPEDMFNAWDKDKNKSLSLDEFKAGWGNVMQANAVVRLQGQFRAHDTNKSGFIEATEFANLPIIKQAGKSAPMLSAYDANADQKLDFKEYISLIETMMKNRPQAAK
ncbi:EF-hand domain-containing protein [Arenimonas sp.]|uniref:EF-hand domain-containing protein n=1 Tax=Arenimonas sp. TaxID=1872635 RepID=UPI0039E67653